MADAETEEALSPAAAAKGNQNLAG